jgi:hypothetical protein
VYRRIAERHGWQIDVSGTGGCYLTSAIQEQFSASDQRVCQGWRRSVIKHANEGGYDAIVVTHSTGDHRVIPDAGQTVAEATVAGLVTAWRRLPDVPIIAIRDNPGMPYGTMICVARNGLAAASACAPSRAEALPFDGQKQAARLVPKARYVDLSDYYCTPAVCPPVVGHVLVYRDGRHMTATYLWTMMPYFDRAIVAALARR